MGENTAKEAAPKAPKKSWFKGLKAEFKKIVWPDKKSLARESAAVVVSAIALGIIIKILDVVCKNNIAIFFIISIYLLYPLEVPPLLTLPPTELPPLL